VSAPGGVFFGYTHILFERIFVVLLLFFFFILVVFVFVFLRNGEGPFRCGAPAPLQVLDLLLIGCRLPVDGLPGHRPEEALVPRQAGDGPVLGVGQHPGEQPSHLLEAQGSHDLLKIREHLQILHGLHLLCPLYPGA